MEGLTIYDKVDAIFMELTYGGEQLPFYYGMPDLPGVVPSVYAVYDVFETPVFFGDGVYHRKSYTVTVDVFSEQPEPALLSDIEQRFLRAGGSYLGGRQMGGEMSYPSKLRHQKEFKIND